MQYASIVQSLYRRKGDEWRRLLSEDARRLLYSERTWRGGRYAAAIAEVVLACREAGRPVFIFTSNHDEYIEQAIREAALAHQVPLAVKTMSLELIERGRPSKSETTSDADAVRVIHVHGGIKKAARRDEKIGSIVLGESDFFVYESDVARMTSDAMRKTNTLLIGTGLEDPNLLRALHHLEQDRRRGNEDRRAIWWITTKPTLTGGEISDEAVARSLGAMEKRLSEFGVAAVLPDTYSQAHQFLFEIAEEIRHGRRDRGYSADDAPHRYGKRLRRWWTDWDADVARDRGARQTISERRLTTQTEHHLALTAVVEQVRQLMRETERPIRATDKIKLELWIRWDPNETNRMLRLWATSLGPWATESGYKDVALSTDSGIAAVRAFCSGAAELIDGGDRWQRYLAVPIEAGQADHQSVIVGVVTVAASRQSLLEWREVEVMRRLVAALPKWTADLVSAGATTFRGTLLPPDPESASRARA